MEVMQKIGEDLHVATLSIQTSQYEEMHHFEIRKRKVHNTFGLILRGSVRFSTFLKTVEAKEGDILFIPAGIRYISHWEGVPHIRFISIHFRLQSPRSPLFRMEQIQKIGEADEEIRRCFLSLAEDRHENEADDLLAISRFYHLCGLLCPRFSHESGRNLPRSLQSALEFVNENYCSITKVSEISDACFISGSHLYRLFAEYLGVSPTAYLNSLRVQEAAERLMTTDKPIGVIASELGFHSEYYFRKVFRQVTGVLPSQYRRTK